MFLYNKWCLLLTNPLNLKWKLKLSTKQSPTKDLLNITPYEFLMKINKSEEPMLTIKAGKWLKTKLGRVGRESVKMAKEEDMELTSPWQTHQKYIYMRNNSHWKLTGNWQKDSCTTEAIKKIHTDLSRKGRETIRSGLVPLGGDSEEKGDYTSRDSPWGVSVSSHILGAPVLGSKPGKTRSLGWLDSY